MRKIALTFAFAIPFLTVKSQTLYGTTFKGGADGGGTISKFIPTANNLTITKSLETASGDYLVTNIIEAADGKLYGMTTYGPDNDDGIIFSIDPSSSTYTKLYDFDHTNGSRPCGNLMQASDQKLYGMTSAGGVSDFGVMFSFDPSSTMYTKLYDFDTTNGANSFGGLMQASDGKLYGLTAYGGFSFDLSSSTYTKLFDFDTTNGLNPSGSLVQASDGKLYGVTNGGGIYGYGGIFSLDPATSAFTKMMDFDGINEGYPRGSLIQATDGKLYGVISPGSNDPRFYSIFSFEPSSSNFTKLYEFDELYGTNPSGSLMQASDGKLYGMGAYGGGTFYGVIFSFDPLSSTYTKVYDFDITNGASPQGSLIQASDGRLYGLRSWGGGGYGYGDIFSFDLSTFAYATLKPLNADDNGSNISASLLRAKDGKLYGMATNGGSTGGGVIFSYDPTNAAYSKLKDLDFVNGYLPYNGLMQATDGKLYGLTSSGGFGDVANFDYNYGTIFSFDIASLTYTRLVRFDQYTVHTGSYPFGSLIQANNEKLYGMTSYGGGGYRGGGVGVIFSFDPATTIYRRVKDFANYDVGGNISDIVDGSSPYGSLLQATDGLLYGMTSLGGTNNLGVLFSYDPVSNIYTKLRDFAGTDGSNPYGSLIQTRDGKLYGMTYAGGSSDGGTIFSYDLASATFTKLKEFDFVDGSHPYGNLMQASDGKLYGMTSSGGTNDLGVIFSFDPISDTYTKLIDYDGSNGSSPYYGSGFIELAESAPLPVVLTNFAGRNRGVVNELSWTALNEDQLTYYELQRSVDGQNFDHLGEVKAIGNATYAYNDNITNSSNTEFYYRLKMVDINNNYKYSGVVKITINPNDLFIVVNPNPFEKVLTITIRSRIPGRAMLVLRDLSGRQLVGKNEELFSGDNYVQIDKDGILLNGIYVLTVTTLNTMRNIKVVKSN